MGAKEKDFGLNRQSLRKKSSNETRVTATRKIRSSEKRARRLGQRRNAKKARLQGCFLQHPPNQTTPPLHRIRMRGKEKLCGGSGLDDSRKRRRKFQGTRGNRNGKGRSYRGGFRNAEQKEKGAGTPQTCKIKQRGGRKGKNTYDGCDWHYSTKRRKLEARRAGKRGGLSGGRAGKRFLG